MSTVRSVSFVEHVTLEFSGNILQEALALGDVDNDGGNELVLGNVDGELSIFKGDCTKPWKTCKNLGMITCIGVGDVFNKGRNFLMCVTAEGWCYIFDVTYQGIRAMLRMLLSYVYYSHYTTRTLDVNRHFSDSIGDLEPLYSQHLASNCKALVVADVDGDGNKELAVAHTDRTVRLYHWDPTPRHVAGSDRKLADTQNVITASSNNKKQSSIKEENLEPTRKLSRESRSGLKDEGNLEAVPDKSEEQEDRGATLGCFQLTRSWTLNGQIGTLVTYNTPTNTHLIVSQPGGSYVILRPEGAKENNGDETATSRHDEQKCADVKEEDEEQLFGVVGISSGNPAVPTYIATLSRTKNTASHPSRKHSRYVAMCTADGSIVLLDGRETLWSLPLEVNGNLFAISKLDITCDGNDELVVCSSDGVTYIADLQQNIVKFKFVENVMSFGAGNFAVTPRNNVPCLVYVTFSNRVIIYHSISQTRMSSSNLNVVISENEKYQGLVEDVNTCIGQKGGSIDQEKQRRLVALCLYGAQQ